MHEYSHRASISGCRVRAELACNENALEQIGDRRSRALSGSAAEARLNAPILRRVLPRKLGNQAVAVVESRLCKRVLADEQHIRISDDGAKIFRTSNGTSPILTQSV